MAEPVTFAFSGRTAMNRFLKAPMTERLCKWNDEDKGEDIVSQSSHPSRQSTPLSMYLTTYLLTRTYRPTVATQPQNTPVYTPAGEKDKSES